MRWTRMPFGKYKEKTLPEIIATDLDYFLHIQPKLQWHLGVEGRILLRRLCSIRIPRHLKRYVVEVYFDRGEVRGFSLVKRKCRLAHEAVRFDHLDMSLARPGPHWAKRDCQKMIECFRRWYFGARKYITKRRIEGFFSDTRNFIKP